MPMRKNELDWSAVARDVCRDGEVRLPVDDDARSINLLRATAMTSLARTYNLMVTTTIDRTNGCELVVRRIGAMPATIGGQQYYGSQLEDGNLVLLGLPENKEGETVVRLIGKRRVGNSIVADSYEVVEEVN